MRSDGDAIPAFIICDARCLRNYGFGFARPFQFSYRQFIKAGHIISSGGLRELAVKLGLDPDALSATVERFNKDARNGIDTEFGRGCRTTRKAPFYAMKLWPGDLGTALGLRTNVNAQVLDNQDRPIEGLYACGNDMNSIFAGTYASGGITLGPALTFGFLAANH